DQRSDLCADSADAQLEALQGAARKQRHSNDRLCAAPAGRSHRARADHADEREIFADSTSFRFMERPNVPRALAAARKLGWQFEIMSTSFFLSRRALRLAVRSGMPRWQDRLFIGLARSSNDATDYFQIPTDRVVEVGTQVTV